MKKLIFIIIVLISIIICETYILFEHNRNNQERLDSITQLKDITLNSQKARIQNLESELRDLRLKNDETEGLNNAFRKEIEALNEKQEAIEILKERLSQSEIEVTNLKAEIKNLNNIKYSQSLKMSFTNEEYEMLCYAVQGEAGIYSIQHKRLVAWTIVNRAGNPRFGNTIKEVLLQKNQYVSMFDWGEKHREILPSTARAVAEVLYGVVPNNSQGSLFFYAPIYIKNQWQIDFFENNYQYLYTVDTHRFLK